MLGLTHHLVMLMTLLTTINLIIALPQEKFALQLLNDNYYFYEGVGYYKPHTNSKGWADAQNSCIQEGGELLIINSVKEAAAVKMLMDIYNLEKVHSGFHSMWSNGNFVTVYGLPLKTTGYEVWSSEDTNEPNSGLCGAVDSQSKLLTLPCNEHKPFICEQQLWTKYLYFQNVGYYKMYEGATGGWVNAYETCERDGAHLLIINSNKEAEVVAKVINSQTDEKITMFYVGFHMLYDTLDFNPDRTFLTVQGQSLNHSGYNIWGYERSPTQNYHCGTVDRNAKFDIHSCNLSLPFICEHEL